MGVFGEPSLDVPYHNNFTGLGGVIRGVRRRESSPWVTSFILFSFPLSLPTQSAFGFPANSITHTQRPVVGLAIIESKSGITQKARE